MILNYHKLIKMNSARKQYSSVFPEHKSSFNLSKKKEQKAALNHSTFNHQDVSPSPQEYRAYIKKRNEARVMQSQSANAIKNRIIAKEACDSTRNPIPAYLQKEARDRETAILKNINKQLAVEIVQLKAIITHRDIELKNHEKSDKILKKKLCSACLDKIRENNQRDSNQQFENQSQLQSSKIQQLKQTIFKLKKELGAAKGELEKIKKSVRCTTINQLKIQTELIIQEIKRLRKQLSDQTKQFTKFQQQGLQNVRIQQELKKLQQVNIRLQAENGKLKKEAEDIKQKQQIYERSVRELKRNLRLNKQNQAKLTEKQKEIEDLKTKLLKVATCNYCQTTKQNNQNLFATNSHLEFIIKRMTFDPRKMLIEQTQISPPNQTDKNSLKRLLTLRFQAQNLSIEAVSSHMQASTSSGEININELLQLITQEPFGLINHQYISTLLHLLCQDEEHQLILIEDDKLYKMPQIQTNLQNYIGQYKLIPSSEQEIFHEAVSSFLSENQYVFKALREIQYTNKQLSEADFREFFKDIVQEPACVDYMLTQIILESEDQEHLSVQRLFQVFYLKSLQSKQSISNSRTSELIPQAKHDSERSIRILQNRQTCEMAEI